MTTATVTQIGRDGFTIVEQVLDPSEIKELLTVLDIAEQSERARGGIRNLLDLIPQVTQLAASSCIRQLVEPVLGESAFAVRGTLFDKTPDANWRVPWHQDLSIAVQERVDADGCGPWSVKAGVVHVQPPVAVLEAMLAIRIHLDDCNEENGPLRVIPGSHNRGRLTAEQIRAIPLASPSISCPVRSGGALLMRPLLLHASSASRSPNHRRVIHIDFASTPLPAGLKWLPD
jgi:ectoine hydroxylase-related dioxygenase (phytanoyl-CoA dioxygenase family)